MDTSASKVYTENKGQLSDIEKGMRNAILYIEADKRAGNRVILSLGFGEPGCKREDLRWEHYMLTAFGAKIVLDEIRQNPDLRRCRVKPIPKPQPKFVPWHEAPTTSDLLDAKQAPMPY
jgi:hypothetical protein